jgi:hypothetical protein
MATIIGNDGSVEIGANALAEVTEFSITEAANTADDTVIGDTARTHVVGTVSWNGSASCYFDSSDTNGQEALTIGASVTLNLYPEGNTSTKPEYTGTATVTGVEIGQANDSIVTRNFTFTGNGALTIGTVV